MMNLQSFEDMLASKNIIDKAHFENLYCNQNVKAVGHRKYMTSYCLR